MKTAGKTWSLPLSACSVILSPRSSVDSATKIERPCKAGAIKMQLFCELKFLAIVTNDYFFAVAATASATRNPSIAALTMPPA
jgi:hypothetical protein